jgi:hypothetical protein
MAANLQKLREKIDLYERLMRLDKPKLCFDFIVFSSSLSDLSRPDGG